MIAVQCFGSWACGTGCHSVASRLLAVVEEAAGRHERLRGHRCCFCGWPLVVVARVCVCVCRSEVLGSVSLAVIYAAAQRVLCENRADGAGQKQHVEVVDGTVLLASACLVLFGR